MVMACGLDSCKEETDAYERRSSRAASRRWCSTGPARARREYDFPIRGDYETAVKAVVDYHRDAPRSRRRPHRPLGREPRRLLRAARRRVREARQGLHRARRPVRLGRLLGRPARAHPRGVPRAQPLRRRWTTRSATPRRCRSRAWRSDITCPIYHHERPARPHRARAADAERLAREVKGPVDLDDHRRRQPRRQQPRLPLARAERGLDGGAAKVGESSLWRTCNRERQLFSEQSKRSQR